jgi:NAD(P)-dependent dehydrogenase (short-subunit alcohol dehydrogenase family)
LSTRASTRGAAIVTGGGGGIGSAVALRFARAGYGVVVSDLGVDVAGAHPSTSAADAVTAQIRTEGGSAVAHYGSVSDEEVARDLVETAVREYGSLAAVITCHGILRERMIFNMTADEWDAVVNVHLRGTYTCFRFATAQMRQQRDGSLVSLTSAAGLEGSPAQANYAAAKAGIVGLTMSTALAMSRYNVNANCIAPSAATRMTARISDRMAGTRPAEERQGPELTAELALALAQPELRHVTGQVFTAAGNRLARWEPFHEADEALLDDPTDGEGVRAALRDRLNVTPPRRFAALGLPLPGDPGTTDG